MSDLEYMSGFGNEFASEAIEGALPEGRNSPQKCPHGLYAEQITGSPFTMPRGQNKRSWFYRIQPSVKQPEFKLFKGKTNIQSSPFDDDMPNPNQMRWDPIPMPAKPTDFIEGLFTVAGNGDLHSWSGLGVHLYAANRDMKDTNRYFYNADGEINIGSAVRA